MTLATVTTLRPAGSDAAIRTVRAYVAQERRLREASPDPGIREPNCRLTLDEAVFLGFRRPRRDREPRMRVSNIYR